MRYECWSIQLYGERYIGVFEGDKDDIEAYLKEKFPGYGYKFNPLTIHKVRGGYAQERSELQKQRQELVDQIKKIDIRLAQ